jgi:hypothetical protein
MANRKGQIKNDGGSPQWATGDTFTDPDGNAIYSVGNPPPAAALPVSGMKGASVVATGSVVVAGQLYVLLEVAAGFRFYWGAINPTGNTPQCNFNFAANQGNAHYIRFQNINAQTVSYKVYRIDEA